MYNIGTLGKLYIMVHLVFFWGVDHVKVSVTLHLEQRIMCFFGISNGAMGRLVDSCQVLKNKGISLLTFRTARVPVVYLPLWKIWVKVSWDDDIPNIWKVIKFMFQTTNRNIMNIFQQACVVWFYWWLESGISSSSLASSIPTAVFNIPTAQT